MEKNSNSKANTKSYSNSNSKSMSRSRFQGSHEGLGREGKGLFEKKRR